MRSAKFVALFVAPVLALTIASCSSESEDTSLTSSDAVFAGLDPVLTSEILANTTVQQKLSQEPSDTRGSLAQGIAINFATCRNVYDIYTSWLKTGDAPELTPLPVPDNPQQPSYDDWIATHDQVEGLIANQDIEAVKSWLSAEGSCGSWIPATPGDSDGLTIAEAIQQSQQ